MPSRYVRSTIQDEQRERYLRELYMFWVNYQHNHDGRPPTFGEAGRHIGITSKSHVAYYVDMLVARGQLRRQGDGSRNHTVVGGFWVPPV